ncbi:hypothetical protein BDZ90DRAFT_166317 [Jaminaea rosea]|uniref:Uncharacterized protein n=1 Tax=Jaminaea rosea TaxID=1569628 RepID=A0A316UWS4_9BASI|nr:hypothetical protein BDZ90DRAFT_166317 [Jaminaea rosea]PWN27575.1 hypothetical protein BDZ90DRAFT_166317 [Jaminaea rosea]
MSYHPHSPSQTSLAPSTSMSTTTGAHTVSDNATLSARPLTSTHPSPSSSSPSSSSHHTMRYGTGPLIPLCIDGADEPFSPILISDPAKGKQVLYELTPPAPPSAEEYGGVEVQGLVTDVHVRDLLRANEHLYTIRTSSSSGGGKEAGKSWQLIPQELGAANATLSPRKRWGTSSYKLEFDAPGIGNGSAKGETWIWKGSVFSSMELYTSSSSSSGGKKKTLAVYLRTSTRSHTLRLYSHLLPSSSDADADVDPLSSNSTGPILAKVIATLYPFLAIYRKHLATDFTSDKEIGIRSASAAPSGWDARLMGDLPKGASGIRRGDGAIGGGAGEEQEQEEQDGKESGDEEYGDEEGNANGTGHTLNGNGNAHAHGNGNGKEATRGGGGWMGKLRR